MGILFHDKMTTLKGDEVADGIGKIAVVTLTLPNGQQALFSADYFAALGAAASDFANRSKNGPLKPGYTAFDPANGDSVFFDPAIIPK